MEMWQRLDNLNISRDVAVLGSVFRNKGRCFIVAPSVGDRRVVVICLMLITSKPQFTRLLEMTSAGILGGICQMTALMGFWNLGKKD
jgi:hypothetical protein